MATSDKKPRKRTGLPSKEAVADHEHEIIEGGEYGMPEVRASLRPSKKKSVRATGTRAHSTFDPPHYSDPCYLAVERWYRAKASEKVDPGSGFEIWAETFRGADRELKALRTRDFTSYPLHQEEREHLESLLSAGPGPALLDIISSYLGRLLDWDVAGAPLAFMESGPVIIPEAEAALAKYPHAEVTDNRWPWPPRRDQANAFGVPDPDLARQFVAWGAKLPHPITKHHFHFADQCLVQFDANPQAILSDMERARPFDILGMFEEGHAAFRMDELVNNFREAVLNPWIDAKTGGRRGKLLRFMRASPNPPNDPEKSVTFLQTARSRGDHFPPDVDDWLKQSMHELVPNLSETTHDGIAKVMLEEWGIAMGETKAGELKRHMSR